MALIDACKNDWKRCEGLRLAVYDDKTAQPIKPQSYVAGHPTIGYGRALDTNGITAEEADYLLQNDMDKIILWATNNLTWFTALSEIRQRVVINMLGNLGRAGFMGFKDFIRHMSEGNIIAANAAMLDSKAAHENPDRYAWLGAMLITDAELHA